MTNEIPENSPSETPQDSGKGKRKVKAAPKAPAAPVEKSAISDAVLQRQILTDIAKAGRYITYGDLLQQLGYSFTRPKMRALCQTLAEVDRNCVADGEPELAVLVVRAEDKLPGQGWWTANPVVLRDYLGPWEGREAGAFIRGQQALAYDYWKGRAD
jgi:hypothetical protein